MSRFLRFFLPLAGALPLLCVYWLYKIGLFLASQVSLARMAGTLGLIGLLLVGTAALLAVLGLALGLDRASAATRERLRAAFFALASLNLVGLGLAVYYWNPQRAPMGALALAVLVLVGLGAAYRRKPRAERALITGSFVRLGHLALLLPLALAPWIALEATRHTTRIPESPYPPASPRVLPDAPKRILLVTFDGLRAATTSLADPRLDATPSLAAIARESTAFTECLAAADKSQASLTTLLTGLYPAAVFPHFRNKSGYIRTGMVSGLPAFLARAGYRSYYATMLVHPSILGLAPEFDDGVFNVRTLAAGEFNTASFLPLRETLGWTFTKLIPSRAAPEAYDQRQVPALRKTLGEARQLLNEHPDRTFMWVHIGAPHEPCYKVPVNASDAVLEAGGFPHTREVVKDPSDPRQVALYKEYYEAYVKFADGELGRFVDGLKADGLWEDSLVVLTSDHGEEMADGVIGHGHGHLSRNTVHVPLVIRTPHQREARRVEALTHHIDVMPTILSRVYAPEAMPKGLPGLPLLGAPPSGDRPLYLYGMFYHHTEGTIGLQSSAVVAQGHTYALHVNGREEKLYRRADDPAEQRNIAQAQPAIASELRRMLRRHVKYPSSR